MRYGSEGGPRGLAERVGPQLNKAVAAVAATIGKTVYAEDAQNVRLTAWNIGVNPLGAAVVQHNDFNPDESDPHWVDEDAVTFAGLAAGATATKVLQGAGVKWYRIRAASPLTTEIDVAWTGE